MFLVFVQTTVKKSWFLPVLSKNTCNEGTVNARYMLSHFCKDAVLFILFSCYVDVPCVLYLFNSASFLTVNKTEPFTCFCFHWTTVALKVLFVVFKEILDSE